MNHPPIDICPLMGGECRGFRCAWWSYEADECAVTAVAEGITKLTEEETDGR